MKPATAIAASVLATAACVPFAAFGATATEPQKAADAQSDKAGAPKVEPHSHLHEKTGIAPQKKAATAKREENKDDTSTAADDHTGAPAQSKSPKAKTNKVKADKDKSKHFHPRDGK